MFCDPDLPPSTPSSDATKGAATLEEVIWIASSDYTSVFYVSSSYERIFGFSRQSLYEKPRSLFETVIVQADRQRAKFSMVGDRPAGELRIVYHICTPWGDVRSIETRTLHLQDGNCGDRDRVLSVSRWVTTPPPPLPPSADRRIAPDLEKASPPDQEDPPPPLGQLQVSESLPHSSKLLHALGNVLETSCRAGRWDFGEIWLPDRAGTRLTIAPLWYAAPEHRDAFEPFYRASRYYSFTLGEGLPGRVWLDKTARWERNVAAIPISKYLRSNLANEVGLKAALGIPLVANSQVLAIMVFYLSQEREADNRLVDLISAMAQLTFVVFEQQGRDRGDYFDRDLEQLVLERTAALQSANEELISEIVERRRTEQALRDSQAQLLERTDRLESALDNLRQTQSMLVHAEKLSSLGQMVAGIAHEINNPASFVTNNLYHACSYTQTLIEALQEVRALLPPGRLTDVAARIDLEEVDYAMEDLPALLQSMQTGTDRIENIVKAMRNLSRRDKDRREMADLHLGLDGTLLILQHRLKANRQRPAIAVTRQYGDLPPVYCFPSQLNQVFTNLIANAIDALDEYNVQVGRTYQDLEADPNEITIETRLESRSCGDKVGGGLVPHAIMVVRDNGPGIDADIIEHLFEPFFTTKGREKGTGLGLSISRQIVSERHGGVLFCETLPEQGTAFTVAVPVDPPHNDETAAESP